MPDAPRQPFNGPQPPQGYQPVPDADRKKAKAFFDRGGTVAGTGQYDYAIEMFMNGLNIDPDSVEAHELLRTISLRRKASGGKALGMFDKMKLKTNTKDDKANMIAAEKLLAYDPGNSDYMLTLMQSAYKAGFYDTVMWIGPILHRAVMDSGKMDYTKFTALKDHYKALSRWDLAITALQAAAEMRPEDSDLQRELKDLAANEAMRQGKYEGGGSFRDSIKDMDAQQKLLQKDSDFRDVDVLTRLVMEAEAEWKTQPDEPGKVIKLVDALVKTENPKNENRAIDILMAFYQKTNQFRFRQSAGQIKMTQRNREDRALREKLTKTPNDEAVREEYRHFVMARNDEEYTEYALWSENYPTDLSIKYEMAKRLFALQRYDEAIPALQASRQDPKLKVDASTALARAFLEAGFVDEAADTLRALIEEYQLKGDAKSKEMYYWFGRALEANNDNPPAIKAYSQVAQWDFGYRDVQQRIKRLRAAAAQPPPAT